MTNVQILGIGGAGLNTLNEVQKALPDLNYLEVQTVEDSQKMMNTTDINSNTLILLAGLGGNMGSSVTPEIAKWAKMQNKKVIAIVYLPFSFEGSKRERNAKQALKLLKENCNQCEIFDNNESSKKSNYSPKEFFEWQSQVIITKIKEIVEL